MLHALIGSPTGRASLVGALGLVALAVLGPWIANGPATHVDVFAQSQGSSARHFLGTDQLGRDILARTIAAARTSLLLAGLAALTSVIGGVALGTVAAVAGRGPRRAMLRTIDLLLAFPALLIAIFVSSVAGVGGTKAALAIGVALIPQFALLCSGLALAASGSDFVVAARASGLRRSSVMGSYVLPAIAGPLAQIACAYAAVSLVAVSSLSFLGLGVQSPGFDWGQMLSEGLQNVYLAPLAVVSPGVAIVGSGIVLALLGDALARAADPRLWAPTDKSDRDVTDSDSMQTPPASIMPPADAVVIVDGLRVAFPQGTRRAAVCVRDVSLAIAPGEMVGIVGESGSGKSLTVSALVGIVPPPGVATARRLSVVGVDPLSDPPRRQARAKLATSVAMIFQDPSASLNPMLTVGYQLTEALRIQAKVSRKEAKRVAVARLEEVGIADSERVLAARPHQLSGGMRQRVMIAMGLAIEPDLLLADEPTTALDLTTQAQIMRLLVEINHVRRVPIVLISHDLALIASVCDRILVMYGGRIVEELSTASLAQEAAHPYTRALLAAEPRVDDPQLPRGIAGDPPDPTREVIAGCSFAPRCDLAGSRCRTTEPPRIEVAAGHALACWAVEVSAQRKEESL